MQLEARKGMDKTRYEQHIARLEEQIQTLRDSNRTLEERARNIEKEKEVAKLHALQGISAFMSKLYSDLGEIQTGLLKHIADVNAQLNKEHNSRAQELLREMSTLFRVEHKSASEDYDS